MVLRDSASRVVDSLNFGGMVDPWAAEGYQALSGSGANGCSTASPGAGGRGGFGGGQAQPPAAPNRSSGRFPDGADSDSNCNDFQTQSVTTLAAAAAAGTNNLKLASTSDFAPGQMIAIDAGDNLETVIVATSGTQGAAISSAAVAAGATSIPVASQSGFTSGQTITIDSGANMETAVVVSAAGGRGGFGGRGGQQAPPAVTLAAPLTRAHDPGAPLSGTGVTIMGGLARSHEAGAQVSIGKPTPGAPNQYRRR
jgi:hypothetical protein